MLDYFFFLFCFLSFFNIKVKGIDNFFFDYMELENTNSIKGIFVWLIIFCHKNKYGIKKRFIYKIITKNLGQKVVSLFLFYSSYGIYESRKKKGLNYVKTLPFKGLVLFLKFQIILLMFLITNVFILKKKISLKVYFLSFIFKSALGNSNWFAFSIIIFYLYSYLSFSLVKDKTFIGIIFINIICLLHIKFVYTFFYPKALYAVDTVLCFIFGFYFSSIKFYFDRFIMKSDIYYFGSISVLIFLYYKYYYEYNLLYNSMKNVLFAFLVIIISMKVKFSNDFLKFLNSHSYSIYLLQRLVMLIVYKKHIFQNSYFIQISFEFTLIFFISSLFDKYTSFINTFFRKRNLKDIKMKNIYNSENQSLK